MNFDKICSFFNNLIKKENNITIPLSNQYARKYDYEKFSNEEDYIPYSKSDIENIFYNILNNGWDEFIFYCPDEYESCANDIEEISSDATLMSNVSSYVNPFNAFSVMNTTVSSYGEVYVNVSKKYTENEINEVNSKLNSLILELDLNGKTKEKKLKTFHDYIIKNTIYDDEFAEKKQSNYKATKANGVLIDGYAVCGGYTDALAIFLDILNIPNIIVFSENHAWNMVYIDDEWLHIDATWNDTENEKFQYEFYLVNTEKLLTMDAKQHTFDPIFFKEAY